MGNEERGLLYPQPIRGRVALGAPKERLILGHGLPNDTLEPVRLGGVHFVREAVELRAHLLQWSGGADESHDLRMSRFLEVLAVVTEFLEELLAGAPPPSRATQALNSIRPKPVRRALPSPPPWSWLALRQFR